jgi:hypothetical protein
MPPLRAMDAGEDDVLVVDAVDEEVSSITAS